MTLDDFTTPNRHEQFLAAITDHPVEYDTTQPRANTYTVGNEIRVWYHHAGHGFAGIGKQTRHDLTTVDDRHLIHLFILETKASFRNFIATHEHSLTEVATQIDWYALPDTNLDQYSTAGSPEKYNVNKTNFDNMTPYKHDNRDVLC